VPLPLSTKLTPVGKMPSTLTVGAGNPDVVTWKDRFCPVVNVALAAEVMAGPWPTVSVKVCVATGDTPFVAAILTV
jgi:hypothetical protein